MKIIKYFFEFIIVISLFCIFKIIGLNNASNLGNILGKIVGPFFRSKNITKQNIRTGLGNLDEKNEKEIINSMWSNIGRTFAEYIFLKNFKSNKTGFNHMKITGVEYIDQIKKSSKPVVFFSGHFANFELMAMELNKFGIKLAAIYRPLNNFFLNPLMEYLRIKYICPVQIQKGVSGSREIVKKIKDEYSIALMVDQRVSEGPRLSFFNKEAHTTTIPVQIALKYNCKLVPIYIERKNGINFEMVIHEPYEITKTGVHEDDLKNNSLTINKKIEKMIIKNPTQWIWTHDRWK